MISRRDFLIASAAMLGTACTKGAGKKAFDALATNGAPDSTQAFSTKGTHYFVPTPHIYFKTDQDLITKVKYDRVIPSPKGWKLNQTSTITVIPDNGRDVKRIRVPTAVHSIGRNKKHDLIYLVSVDQPATLIAMNPHTFEVVSWLERPSEDENFIFSGHAIDIPGTDFIATGMTGMEKGKHDHIAIRHAKTLKVEQRISTHGFEVHEIVLSPDGKTFACAHYGSYMGTGPYKEIGLGYVYHYAKDNTGFTYPAFVSMVNAASGKLESIWRDPLGGQHGHVALASGTNEPFIPHLPPFLAKENKIHPRYLEGVQEKPIFGDEFQVKSNGLGVTVTFDQIHREVVIPARYKNLIVIGSEKTRKVREIDITKLTTQRAPHGLEYHPDGKHYLVSTTNGMLAFERGTHKLVESMSFGDIFLAIHSHFTIYSQG
jgi:hypothetical protein